MAKPDFNAAAAQALRQRYFDAETEDGKKALGHVLSYAEDAATKGQSSVTMAADSVLKHHVMLMPLLQERGFKVEFKDDQRDGAYLQISW